MGTYCVSEADSLQGELTVQGSKNAALPMMAACVLHKGTTVLKGCPDILDVRNMCILLESIGCRTSFSDGELVIDAGNADGTSAGREEAGKMRSSIMLAGAMLGRNHEVTIAYPGGCSIGKRPIDLHLRAFEKLGAMVEEKEDGVYCKSNGLTGSVISFRFPSVGATENAILAAVLADGGTKICNAAREPEIISLCRMLNMMGADISGAGSRTILVQGVDKLHDAQIRVPSDRIVTGTYLCAVAGCGGNVTLKTDCANDLMSVYPVLEQLGCRIVCTDSYISIEKQEDEGATLQFTTGVYPKFPTDLQPQMMAVFSRRKGHGIIIEDIFENRFAQAPQLCRMGAEIHIIDNIAVVNGRESLQGADVAAYDLRGGAAMVLAGLLADGVTHIHQVSYIERGYEDICRDFRMLGAKCGYSCEDGGIRPA